MLVGQSKKFHILTCLSGSFHWIFGMGYSLCPKCYQFLFDYLHLGDTRSSLNTFDRVMVLLCCSSSLQRCFNLLIVIDYIPVLGHTVFVKKVGPLTLHSVFKYEIKKTLIILSFACCKKVTRVEQRQNKANFKIYLLFSGSSQSAAPGEC